jgi:signal transduction histidine kinase
MIFGVLSILVYYAFNLQRERVQELTNRFAFIGQQAAFLLHELKSPLARFMSKHTEVDNKDAEYIYSIIEGVELLVSKQGPKLLEFEWGDIAIYLKDEFSEICEHYQIKLELEGIEGRAIGHKSTLRLALKNLVKNAIEAIAQSGKPGTIWIKRKGTEIEVRNNGPLLTSEKIQQIFKPFYSEKSGKQNFGIGLHFVESVVNAHKGKIDVQVQNEVNIFRIKLGEII